MSARALILKASAAPPRPGPGEVAVYFDASVGRLRYVDDAGVVHEAAPLTAPAHWSPADSADWTASNATKTAVSYGGVTGVSTSALGRMTAPFASASGGCDWQFEFRRVDTSSAGAVGFGVELTGAADVRLYALYNNQWYRGVVTGAAYTWTVVAGSSYPDGYPFAVRVVVAAGSGARNVSVYTSSDGESWDLIETVSVDAAKRCIGGASGSMYSVLREFSG